jgi:hypothetical protein
MKIKEHFTKMLITLGWATTGCVILYGLVFTVSKLWDLMWLCMGS